mgnify:CR=1 FL=1
MASVTMKPATKMIDENYPTVSNAGSKDILRQIQPIAWRAMVVLFIDILRQRCRIIGILIDNECKRCSLYPINREADVFSSFQNIQCTCGP